MKKILIVFILFISCETAEIKPEDTATGKWIGEMAADPGAYENLKGVWTFDIVQKEGVITWITSTYQLIGDGYESPVFFYHLIDGYIDGNYIQMFWDTDNITDDKTRVWKGFINKERDRMELDYFLRDGTDESIHYQNINFVKQ